MTKVASRPVNKFDLSEWAGAFGDLGTLIPFVAAYIAILKMNPNGMLVAFGIALIAVGFIYRTPFPVQPMKAIGASAVKLSLAKITSSEQPDNPVYRVTQSKVLREFKFENVDQAKYIYEYLERLDNGLGKIERLVQNSTLTHNTINISSSNPSSGLLGIGSLNQTQTGLFGSSNNGIASLNTSSYPTGNDWATSLRQDKLKK